jgi:hypothetical protein
VCWLYGFFFYHILLCSFGSIFYDCTDGCVFCVLLFKFVYYVLLMLRLCILIVMYVPFYVFCFILLFCVLFICKCTLYSTVLYCTVLYCTVLYYCHVMSTHVPLTDIYHISETGGRGGGSYGQLHLEDAALTNAEHCSLLCML